MYTSGRSVHLEPPDTAVTVEIDRYECSLIGGDPSAVVAFDKSSGQAGIDPRPMWKRGFNTACRKLRSHQPGHPIPNRPVDLHGRLSLHETQEHILNQHVIIMIFVAVGTITR